jgi:hypothetical protein
MPRMQALPLSHLSDHDLFTELRQSCAEGNRLTAERLAFLGEVEERRLHLLMASPSMYDFCRRRLGMSEGRAHRHVAGARLGRRYPFLLPQIANGELYLSTLTLMAPYLTDENIHELLEETRGKSRTQVDVILSLKFGMKSYPPRFGPSLFMDDELHALVTWARDHFSNVVPSGDISELTKRVYAELKTRIDKEERRALVLPASAAKTKTKTKTKTTKTIPRANRRHVHARDEGRCTYVDPNTGERCPAKAYLQLDHIVGRADGGEHGIENLRLACRAHNAWFAELRYGKEYIQKRIRLRQRKPPRLMSTASDSSD